MDNSKQHASNTEAQTPSVTAPRRAYLEKLQGYEPTTSWGVDRNDERLEEWAKEQERYGFDSRQTWSLDIAMVELLYERLSMYLEIAENTIDLEIHVFEFEGEKLNQREAIKQLLSMAKLILTTTDFGEELRVRSTRFWSLWAITHPVMWW